MRTRLRGVYTHWATQAVLTVELVACVAAGVVGTSWRGGMDDVSASGVAACVYYIEVG